MSKRNIEKHILMNKAEAQDLQKKAKRAYLPCEIRLFFKRISVCITLLYSSSLR